ncbi:hypothetical protein RND81_07G039500 [Saponaria officinalis]|uniref:Wall-associated receptor kinase C-terminal domain-containing protein n=1 Tax=Saponaria officinalis TaxID=3572 RepID=A0AAW1JMV3_SAPOF
MELHSKDFARKFAKNSVICGAVGVYQNASKLDDLKSECERMVSVPYDGDISNVSIVKEMLEKGFSLKWVANNCSTCEYSGGRCGYDQDLEVFRCFCPDQIGSLSCGANPLYADHKSLALSCVSPSIILALECYSSICCCP